MVNSDKLPHDVRSALQNRGHTEDAIQQLSPVDAFEEYLAWNGVIGYGHDFWHAAKAIQAAEAP